MGCTSSKQSSSSSSSLPPKTINAAPTTKNTSNTDNIDADNPQPIKKVRTDFSDVNYTDPSSGRRDTVYAPGEVPEAQRPGGVGEVPLTSVGGEGTVGGDANGIGKGAVSGDGAGNGVLGGRVVGRAGGGGKGEGGAEGEGEGEKGEKGEVAWDALSPGSTPGPVS